MDITPIFNQVLAKHDARPTEPPVFRVEALDGFVKEAYRIRGHIAKLHTDLKSIRQSYLSTAHAPRRKQYARAGAASASADKDAKYLSDTQRNEIDAQAKLSIHQLKDAIEKLGAAEQVRQETQTQVALKKRAKQGLGALGRWAAGGAITAKSVEEEIEEAKANTIREHRKGILWTLDFQLEQCVLFQTDMMEIRHMREVEKSKSVLYKTRATGPASSDYSGMDESHNAGNKAGDYRAKSTYNPDESSAVIENQLDPEQLQLFAQENQDMLKQYEDQLDKVRATEKSLMEISELHSTLASNLSIQETHINQLIEDSFNTTENVGSGNKELKRATERGSTAQKLFWATSIFCTTLVVWDLFI
ncbi:unnamed protein product [Alternaria alternata]